jgi:predicted RNA-binding protein with PIN domain
VTHYLIDGYNWLFRTLHHAAKEESLKFERERMLHELSLKLNKAKIQATVVFDSQYNPDPAERWLSKGITIYFTDSGQTADDFILEFIKYASNPAQYTIVTSDERLAWRVREKASTMHIQEFKQMLNRIYTKKQRIKPQIEKPPMKVITPAPRKTLQDRYEEIFSKNAEEEPKPGTKNKPLKKKPIESCELISDFERWKKIFEGENGA